MRCIQLKNQNMHVTRHLILIRCTSNFVLVHYMRYVTLILGFESSPRPSCIECTLPPRVLYYIAFLCSLLKCTLYSFRFRFFLLFGCWSTIDPILVLVMDIECEPLRISHAKADAEKNKCKLLMRFRTIYVQYTPICF